MDTSLVKERKTMTSKQARKMIQDVKHGQDQTFSRFSGSIREDPFEEIVRIVAAGIAFVLEAIYY